MDEKNTENKTFEEMLAELEKIVARLEAGEIPLEEAMSMYAQGTFLASECAKLLDSAEKQIKILTRGENGDVVLADFSEN